MKNIKVVRTTVNIWAQDVTAKRSEKFGKVVGVEYDFQAS